MAKFKIRQNFSNGSSSNTYIQAASEALALGVAQNLMDSNLEVLSEPAGVPATLASATNVAYKKFSVVCQDSATGNKTFVNFVGKSTVSIIDVETFFKGKTINGVVSIDLVTVGSKSFAVA